MIGRTPTSRVGKAPKAHRAPRVPVGAHLAARGVGPVRFGLAAAIVVGSLAAAAVGTPGHPADLDDVAPVSAAGGCRAAAEWPAPEAPMGLVVHSARVPGAPLYRMTLTEVADRNTNTDRDDDVTAATPCPTGATR